MSFVPLESDVSSLPTTMTWVTTLFSSSCANGIFYIDCSCSYLDCSNPLVIYQVELIYHINNRSTSLFLGSKFFQKYFNLLIL